MRAGPGRVAVQEDSIDARYHAAAALPKRMKTELGSGPDQSTVTTVPIDSCA